MNKLLLREYQPICAEGCRIDILTEAEHKLKNEGFTILTGVIQVANRENGNRRRYPREVLEREMENYSKLIREHRAYGELDHSDNEIVSLAHVSHLLVRHFWEGDNVMGVVKVLKTPSGLILEQILAGGGVLGISSRALGSLNEAGIVGEDLQIISYDIVSAPSAPGAYLHLQEGQQRNYDPKKVFTKADRIYRALMDIK